MVKFYAATSAEISEREQNHMRIVRKLAAECMVLLENDGTLPLQNPPQRVALYGNGARHTVKGGTGSGDVNSRSVINIEQGFEAEGFTVSTKSWLNEYEHRVKDAKKAYSDKLEAVKSEQGESASVLYYLGNPFKEPQVQPIMSEDVHGSDTDTAIYVLARNSGEGKDRTNEEGDYHLAAEELAAIRFLAESYTRCIVLLNIGGVIDTTQLRRIQGINAIVLIGQSGNIAGHAVTDVLLGNTVPSGKLTDTWAASYSDYPSSDTFSHMNGNLDDEYYTEGIYVGYRYFDTLNIAPNYCFGYGKSYTEFAIQTLNIAVDGEIIRVIAEVENTGKLHPGREVVQVYTSAPAGALEKPYQELAAFAKTKLLAPGEKEILHLSFPARAMASYSEQEAAWVLETGNYYVRVGNHSRNTKVEAVVALPDTVKTVQLKNLFRDSEELKEMELRDAEPYTYATEATEKEQARVIVLDTAQTQCETADYQSQRPLLRDLHPNVKITIEDVKNQEYTLEELIAQLTVQEMAELCVGTSRGQAAVVGNAAQCVPGAGGETAALEDRGIRNMVLADGPAGLRLTPHFRTTLEGELLPGGEMFGDQINPLSAEAPEGTVDYYQYCTAVPIATTLAQSWDMEVLETVGRIVGKEMAEFQVHLWLAPGMNIHRNPLCGRNFEYYSEDPLLTGKCAAAETRGVQAYPGRGTTLKHYAANNHEDNRMFTNTHVSERALREIYLMGFEIAVKESGPLSIMTSYNLLNGTHTANHVELIQSVARDEWGFDGLVMSDWYTSIDLTGKTHKYPISSSPLCVKAGNDLQMPGSKENIDDIITAIELEGVAGDETLTLADLQFCTLNLLKVYLQIP